MSGLAYDILSQLCDILTPALPTPPQFQQG